MRTAAPALESISGTFLASIRSVGTAVTLAAVGVYLHRRGFVVGEGKRTLALISQQVTFPLFLFTKILYCNQDWSSNPCPDVTQSLADVWMLLFWPLYVVTCGVLVGRVVAKWTHTPSHQVRAVMAACGFSNSTGLPITLLTVVHANFPATSDLGRIDPTLFLSVYLLLYPVLQWGYGGWLLAPEQDEEQEMNVEATPQKQVFLADESESSTKASRAYQKLKATRGHLMGEQTPTTAGPPAPVSSHRSISNSISESLRHNVLNNQEIGEYYRQHRHGLSSADEGLYMSELDLVSLARQAAENAPNNDHARDSGNGARNSNFPMIPEASSPYRETNDSISSSLLATPSETFPLLSPSPHPAPMDTSYQSLNEPNQQESLINVATPTVWKTIQNIASRCLQPPVIGALAGIFCAATPIRGLFVDLVDRDASAPLEWIFDGLHSVGLSAVPINMMILGCNLSASFQAKKSEKGRSPSLLPVSTMIGVVIGKMIILPIIGLFSCWFLKHFVLDIPDDIDGAFYLVLMIVFLTPTANNVMVMVELSGSGVKEGIASVIALQYAVAPIILSLTMSVAIGFASNWS